MTGMMLRWTLAGAFDEQRHGAAIDASAARGSMMLFANQSL